MITGFLAAIIVGFTLGLIGGGGSILTVPALVYLFDIDPVLATGYSLFVVGVSSAVGSLNYMRAGLLDYKAAFVFAAPSLAAVYATRKFLLPSIPDRLFSIGALDISTRAIFYFLLAVIAAILIYLLLKKAVAQDKRFQRAIWLAVPAAVMAYAMRQFVIPALPETLWVVSGFTLTKSAAIMLLFGTVMFASSISMIRENKRPAGNEKEQTAFNYSLIVAEGAIVGTITGLVGAGGGFLIIPALVILAKLPMKLAIGTSLLIIASKSLIGFLGDVANQAIDWPFLLIFTSFAVTGIFGGTYASRLINGDKLKKGFGWFVLMMAVYIIAGELFFS